eukprot:scaffold124319_cov85-Cyclotella_meneghiniana.AAC.4
MPTPRQTKQRRLTVTRTIIGFVALIVVESTVRCRFGIVNLHVEHKKKTDASSSHRNDVALQSTGLKRKPYRISESVKNEYKLWHSNVRKLSQMDQFPTDWSPNINWKYHPKVRSERFPTVEERIEYYMGVWRNTSIPMYGEQFHRDTYIQRQSTLQYEAFADILVNLYDLDKDRLLECYRNKKELRVFAPYCRDYIDIAVLHSDGLANVVQFIGDALPSYVPDELIKYPMFAKVRPLCNPDDSGGYLNNFCRNDKWVRPIILPLNRKRHLGVATEVPNNDMQWEKKKPKAVWRGKFDRVDTTSIANGFIGGSNDMKYALVSQHLNSLLVNAKFSKHNDDAPGDMVGSYLDMKEQLKYRYIISIEGESWAMEGKLEPFVHYIPIHHNMSNVKEMIDWAESHQEQARLISERSTLFIYDLLFHPDAANDEREIIQGIMETYENNFGPLREHKPLRKSKQTSSIEERAQFYLGKFSNARASMKRENIDQIQTLIQATNVTKDRVSIASGSDLYQCAYQNVVLSQYDHQWCKDALIYFDERNTADLKSNSFKRLLKTEKGHGIKFANQCCKSISLFSFCVILIFSIYFLAWRNDSKSTKDSKRVLLDDSIKVVNFGTHAIDLTIPVFSRRRRIGPHIGSILWPFDLYNTNLTPESISTIDTDFSTKHARVVKVETPIGNDEASRKDIVKYRYIAITEDIICDSHDLVVSDIKLKSILKSGETHRSQYLVKVDVIQQ